MRRFPAVLSCLLVLALCAPAPAGADDEKGKAPTKTRKPYPRALIKTSKGDITVELFTDAAPKTVATWLGLATGSGEFTDIRSKRKVTISKPFYDGLTFHRVIKGFMLQTGCPNGNGMGGPGFMFDDEMDADALGLDKQKVVVGNRPHPWVGGMGQNYWQKSVLLPVIRDQKIDVTKLNKSPELQNKLKSTLQAMSLKQLYELQGFRYTKGLPSKPPIRGTLAMANGGPKTNGSQFFIMTDTKQYLTGRHTVFGRVVQGMEVVDAISKVRTSGPPNDKPLEAVRILSIRKLP